MGSGRTPWRRFGAVAVVTVLVVGCSSSAATWPVIKPSGDANGSQDVGTFVFSYPQFRATWTLVSPYPGTSTLTMHFISAAETSGDTLEESYSVSGGTCLIRASE